MRVAIKLAISAALLLGAAAPSFAADAMMLKKGETMMVMPNGHMSMMMKTDKMTSDMMMKEAKPVSGCVMMMMGADGKMYMMNDMKMADGKMACDSAMMMHKSGAMMKKDTMMKKM